LGTKDNQTKVCMYEDKATKV